MCMEKQEVLYRGQTYTNDNVKFVTVGDWGGKITNSYDFAKKYNKCHSRLLKHFDKFDKEHIRVYNITHKMYKPSMGKAFPLITFDSSLELILLGVYYFPCVKLIRRDGKKTCPKCGIAYPPTLEYFTADTATAKGLYGLCKICKSKTNKIYNSNNKEIISKNTKQRALKIKNTPELQKAANRKAREIRQADPLGRIKNTMRSSLVCLFKSGKIYKQKHTFDYIGACPEKVIEHLNSGQYTLDDYMKNKKGRVLFHIDHIIPSNYFKSKIIYDVNNVVTNPEVLYKWWNYKNLRIWPALANISKSTSLDIDLIKKHKIEHLL